MKKKDFVAEDILSKIYQGYYKIDEKLPTERDLGSKYKVSRHTIREALKRLVGIGSIISIQGSGNYVSRSNYGSSLIYNSLTEKTFNEIKSKVIYLKKVEASGKLSEIFSIDEGEELWEFKRLRLVDYQKVQIELTRLPYKLFKDLTKEIVKGSIHSYVKGKKKDISHFITTYSPVGVSSEEGELLTCKKGTPAMKIVNRGILKNSEVFEYSETISLEYSCTYISTFNKVGHQKRVEGR